MKDRLIKRERDSTIAAENNSTSVTAGERGDGELAQRKRIMRESEKPRDGLVKA